MGLDMFAFTTHRAPKRPVDFKAHAPQELHYWRKHPNLHGWMEALYRAKGGMAAHFNCVTVQLTADDLDRLDEAIRKKELPFTTGFFFGETEGDEQEDDLLFVTNARAAIQAGKTVYYDSWW